MPVPDPLILRFHSEQTETQTVPASALARALDGFQRIVYLIGMRQEGRSLERRARPSQDIQRRFVLVCDLPKPGSFMQPLRLASSQAELLTEETLGRTQADLGRFLAAIGEKSELALEGAVPDATYRRFMLDAFADAMPDPRSGIALDVLSAGKPIVNSTSAQSFVEDQRRPRLTAASAGIVNGELTEIDFTARRLTLRILGGKREITCSYEDAVEPTLLEHPRELIQVYGSVSVDRNGAPRKIEAVEFIRPIREEETFLISTFMAGNKTVRARSPFLGEARFDRDDQLFYVSSRELDIEAVGETRDDAMDGFLAELPVLWRNYAQADDAKLTAGAKRLKQILLKLFEDSADAA